MTQAIRSKSVLSLVIAAVLIHAGSSAAEEPKREKNVRRGAITKLQYDPTASRVEFFEGMKAGSLETKVIAMGPEHGSLLVTNTTDQPLTVDMPDGFVAVSVLKQFGQGGGQFGGGGGGLGGGGGGLGGQQGGGGQQSAGGGLGGGQQGGGGLGGGGLGGGGQQGGGGGFFSIPPEKTVKVPYVSACLNHGKPDPTPQGNFLIVPVDEYTQDPVLQELIRMVGTGRLAPQSAQAAIWNRTDNMSWQALASKVSYGITGNKVPYFSQTDLVGAQMIMATAEGRLRERGQSAAIPTSAPQRTR